MTAKTKQALARPIEKATAKAPAKSSSKNHLGSVIKLQRPSLMAQLGPSSPSQKMPPRVQAMVDKSEIADVVYVLCRGIDRMDETLLRSIFYSEATVDLGPGLFQGTANDYVPWELGVLQQVRSSHHMVGNIRVDIEGDTALVESYFQAHYRLDKPTGREDVFMGGRFLDRMDRKPSGPAGVWKIAHHKKVMDWVRTEGVSEIFYHQNPDALWSYRTKVDLSYSMANFPGGPNNGSKNSAYLGRRYETKSVKF